MCDKLTDVDRARHDFASQGIFERRKTQYNLLLFYLGATGACLSVVLSSSQPETRVLVLLVPILLEIPIYTLWWYQRDQLYGLDVIRKKIIRREQSRKDSWQAPLGKYANDVIIILSPWVSVFFAKHILKGKNVSVLVNSDFMMIFMAAIGSTFFSMLVFLFYSLRQYYLKRRSS
jgi:hypothetical protein